MRTSMTLPLTLGSACLELLNRLACTACVLGFIGALGLLASLALDHSRRRLTWQR